MDSNTPLIIRIKNLIQALKKSASYLFLKLNFVSRLIHKLPIGKKFKNDPENHALIQKELDKKLVYSLMKSRFPSFRQIKYLKKYLSPSERYLMSISIFLLVSSSLFLGVKFYFNHLVTTPLAGGEYREALLGAPRAINPLYANLNDVDNDLTDLVYSSLFTRGVNSELNKDLVSDFFVSTDNKIYDFTIRNDVKWHDGTTLTVSDIVFTFNAISDQAYKSSLRQSFSGVKLEAVDDYNFKFILNSPYAAFLDLLTFGILPARLWSNIQPESANLAALNLKPIGSGPYKFDSISKDSAGTIKEYKLSANENYYEKAPYLDLIFKFYSSFDEALVALNNNNVDGISYLPTEYRESLTASKSFQFHKLFFPQITLVFFNQKNNPSLADKAVRQALAYAIDKRAIVNDILDANAYIVDSPILANSFAFFQDIKKYTYNKEKAAQLLDEVDWKTSEINNEAIIKANENIKSDDEKIKAEATKILAMGEGKWRIKDGNYLKIKLSTVERQENQEIIERIKKYWEEVGVKTDIEVLTSAQIQGEVLRGKNFEALFYAQVLGSDPDPYAFWHSSQAEQGYNIAMYSNKEVDKLLEEARLNVELPVRQEKYKKFQEIIAEDEPAIFMYSPHYTYVQKSDIKGFAVQNILVPKDRFSNVTDWYLKIGKKIDFSKE